jgi:heme/copper-type cytochrome/quinol oxidase subunit 3
MSAPIENRKSGKEAVPRGAALDVSRLPTFAFGTRSPMWWGTMGLVAVESTVFALTIMAYFYLRSHAATWPTSRFPPDLLWGNVNTAIMLLSLWPNQKAKQAAERLDLAGVRLWMSVCMVVSVAFLAVRVLEFGALNTSWDTDAYDSLVLTVLMFKGPLEGKRYVDVSENAGYWYFVVLSWLPIYAVIYWGARF